MPKIVEGVYVIPGRDEFLPDSHTYIIGKPGSEDLSLIDPGLSGKGAYKLEAIRKEGIDLSHIKRVIMTHTHLDHMGAFSEIKKEIPAVELWVQKKEADPLEAGDDQAVYGMNEFKGMCQMQFGLKPGAFTLPVQRKLEGSETLEIGDMVWDVLFIPGHSMGGIGLYNPVHEILIPGDVIYADSAIGRFDLYGASGPELKASLLKLADLTITILLPGHNQVVGNLPAGYVTQVVKMWGPYLA